MSRNASIDEVVVWEGKVLKGRDFSPAIKPLAGRAALAAEGIFTATEIA
jgi:hypothetical protein